MIELATLNGYEPSTSCQSNLFTVNFTRDEVAISYRQDGVVWHILECLLEHLDGVETLLWLIHIGTPLDIEAKIKLS